MYDDRIHLWLNRQAIPRSGSHPQAGRSARDVMMTARRLTDLALTSRTGQKY